MKVVIMCAGKGERWGKSIPKELALVEDVPNVIRTIQMVGNLDVTISTSESKKFYYRDYKIIIGSDLREIDRFRNLFGIMQRGLVILYGDCIYHKDDLKKILTPRKYNTFYGRSGKNLLSGKSYGEVFGVYIAKPKQFIKCVNTVAKLFDELKIKREIAWEVLKVQSNVDPASDLIPMQYFVELSHQTDDYDTPREYDLVTMNCL